MYRFGRDVYLYNVVCRCTVADGSCIWVLNLVLQVGGGEIEGVSMQTKHCSTSYSVCLVAIFSFVNDVMLLNHFLSCQNFFWWVICLFVLWKKMLTFFFKDVHIQILFFKLLMIYNDILLAHNQVLLLFLSVTLYTSILCSYLPLYVKGLCPAYKGLNPCKITKIISMHQLDWGDAHVLFILFIRAIDNFL